MKYLMKICTLSVIALVISIVIIGPISGLNIAQAAACKGTITLERFPKGNGPPTNYSSSQTVKASDSDVFKIITTINSCVAQSINVSYKLEVKVNDQNLPIDSGLVIQATQENSEKDLSKPSNGKYAYTLTITQDDGKVLNTNTVAITFSGLSTVVSKPQVNAPAITVVPPKIDDPFNGRGLLAISLRIIDFLLYIIVIVAVIVIIIAGFRMVAGGGNPATIATAKKSIIWALVGVTVAIMSFAIVSIIQKFIA